jgi:hypothetical protein
MSPGTISTGVKRPGREPEHLPPSSAEVKNEWRCYLHFPMRLHAVVLNQQRDSFYFTLSSVGTALEYGLGDWGSRVQFPAGAGNFSLHPRVQNGSGAHPASYPMGTRGSFLEGKLAGA